MSGGSVIEAVVLTIVVVVCIVFMMRSFARKMSINDGGAARVEETGWQQMSQ